MKTRLILFVEALLGFPAAAKRFFSNIGQRTVTACNNWTLTQHTDAITKTTSVAISLRYLLGKPDPANLSTGVVVAGLGDRALFVISDNPSSTDLIYNPTPPVSCWMIGVANKTLPMVANAALPVGTFVYPVAGGYVDSYANIGTGTNYPVGIVVASPSAQKGDIVEVSAFLGTGSATA